MESSYQVDLERFALKRYLSQYYYAKKRQRNLEHRLNEVRAELRHPTLSSPSNSGLPSGGSISKGAAALTLREAEIEDKIMRQKVAVAETIQNVMDIIELLPKDSIERDIMELRHIDRKPWHEINRLVHLTRSPCFAHYQKGLDHLLAIESVRKTISDYEAGITSIRKAD